MPGDGENGDETGADGTMTDHQIIMLRELLETPDRALRPPAVRRLRTITTAIRGERTVLRCEDAVWMERLHTRMFDRGSDALGIVKCLNRRGRGGSRV